MPIGSDRLARIRSDGKKVEICNIDNACTNVPPVLHTTEFRSAP